MVLAILFLLGVVGAASFLLVVLSYPLKQHKIEKCPGVHRCRSPIRALPDQKQVRSTGRTGTNAEQSLRPLLSPCRNSSGSDHHSRLQE